MSMVQLLSGVVSYRSPSGDGAEVTSLRRSALRGRGTGFAASRRRDQPASHCLGDLVCRKGDIPLLGACDQLLDRVLADRDASQRHRQGNDGIRPGTGRTPLFERHIGASMAFDVADGTGADASIGSELLLSASVIVAHCAQPVLLGHFSPKTIGTIGADICSMFYISINIIICQYIR